MGGRLGRKKRGYNVSEPKESRAAAESAENLEVRQNVPENQAASKEQVKTTDLPKQPECPVKADERPGEKQTALVAAGVKTAELNAAVATGSTSAELDGSKMQENAVSDGLVEATKQLPDQAEEPLLRVAVQSTALPETNSAAEGPDAPVPSENGPQCKEIPDCSSNGAAEVSDVLGPSKNEPQSEETPDCSSNGAAEVSDALGPSKNEPQSEETPDCVSNGEMGESVTEITDCCSTEKPSLDDQAVTNAEVNSCDNLAVEADPGKVLKGISEEISHNSMALPVSPEPLLQCDPKIETSIQELQSESPVKCELEDVEASKLAAIVEETPIDVVLKHEVATCADLGKGATEPSTRDAQGEAVGEPLHSTKITSDSEEQPDYAQHNSHGYGASVLEDRSQSLKGSGNAPVDTSQVVSCSVTDTVQADPVVESAPVNASPSLEKVTETNCEQTVEPISCQESIEEISLLKTNSELIPDIKITVYGEGLQEEEMKSGAALAFASSPDKLESVALVAGADPQPPNEILPENRSTLQSAELELETLISSDQEMVQLETSGCPTPESGSSACVEKVSNEDSGSTKNFASFVVDGKSAISKSEDDNPPKVSVTNGTMDGELKNQSKVETIGQSVTAEVEENVQANGLGPIGSKTTEQVIENRPPEESCLKLENQTPNSGPLDVNVE
ncbi:fap1 adhesin [Narcine bancroftii]|uniref:fap1 adhesin n=1 Tax=Narcine bancroftii TaxID=1343680 RepID=UPI0038311313